MRTPLMFIAAVLTTSCSQSDPTMSSESLTNPSAPAQLATTENDIVRVCVAGAAFNVSRPIEGIQSSINADIVRLRYTRDDGKKFEYDCKVEGDQVRFRMIDEAGAGTGPGTWSGRGSTIRYSVGPNSIEFNQTFFDGSTDHAVIDF